MTVSVALEDAPASQLDRAITVPYIFDAFDNPLDNRPLIVQQDPSGNLGGGQGATVWDSGLCLAKYIEKRLKKDPQLLLGARVLEIGSGTGLVGLAVAMMGAGSTTSVELTDMPIAIPLLDKNTATVRQAFAEHAFEVPSMTVSPLLWGNEADAVSLRSKEEKPPSHVLISDCFYAPKLYEALNATLSAVCGPETLVWIAYEKRDFSLEMDFWQLFGKTFRFANVPESEQDDMYKSEDIFLFEAKKRN
ncbi:hypothetical protein PhCBS80983_g01901 [Powellomyces hirtus]|uniref:Elongation factor methyltransferase 6 n=1 Tax=Powellomyces hirtus TaxID=109895 RepID=A0A507EB01_9FUNG|nr:hypothetical protein PhCBS80983_g01901 [Powellomyces hirtus]